MLNSQFIKSSFFHSPTNPQENDKSAAKELALLNKIKAHLEDGKLAKTFEEADDEEEQAWLESYNLLTYKPVIYAANVSEDDLADDAANNEGVQAVREYAKGEQSEVFVVCAEIEAEISELDDDEKKMFLEDLGLKESGLEKLIKASYKLLGLIETRGRAMTKCKRINGVQTECICLTLPLLSEDEEESGEELPL